MFLDAVKKATQFDTETLYENGGDVKKADDVYAKWRDWHPSQISHHGGTCCEVSREWMTAMDFSELGGGDVLTGPRWLRQKYNWGCSTFPIFWCEAVRKDTLDCGALAALAHEVFLNRNVKSIRAQLVQRFSKNSTEQWTKSWHDGNTPLAWTSEDTIYHEGCAVVLPDNNIKIWDASAGWWIDPKQRNGYGSLIALRLSAPSKSVDRAVNWGTHRIPTNQWHRISAE